MLGARVIGEPITPEGLNAISNDRRILVLPGSDHQPAGLTERHIVAPVTGDVGFKLRAPPIGVRFWSYCVLWASVPEAAVNKDRDLRPSQCDVGPTRKIPYVDAVPEASAVQLAAKSQFRPSIPSSEAGHEATNRRARCRGRVPGPSELGSHR